MSIYVKQEVKYFVARHNTTTDQEELMQYQSYAGAYMPTQELKSATAFDTVEKAKQLKDMLNMMAQFTGAIYEHYVLKQDSNVTKVEPTV